MTASAVFLCGPLRDDGPDYTGLNSPTGTCPRHGAYLYFCSECHEEAKMTPRRTRASAQKAAPAPAEVRVARPHPLAWKRALATAGGDVGRLEVRVDGAVIVWNDKGQRAQAARRADDGRRA